MGIMDKLNALDRRFGAGRTRSISVRGAQRVGIGFFVAALAFFLADLLSEVSLSAAVMSMSLTVGIFLGRVTEAKAVRMGRGALRDGSDA